MKKLLALLLLIAASIWFLYDTDKPAMLELQITLRKSQITPGTPFFIEIRLKHLEAMKAVREGTQTPEPIKIEDTLEIEFAGKPLPAKQIYPKSTPTMIVERPLQLIYAVAPSFTAQLTEGEYKVTAKYLKLNTSKKLEVISGDVSEESLTLYYLRTKQFENCIKLASKTNKGFRTYEYGASCAIEMGDDQKASSLIKAMKEALPKNRTENDYYNWAMRQNP